MRALPWVSLAYFGSTALGKTAGPAGAGAAAGVAAAGVAAAFGLASAAFGAASAAAGVAAASDPHSALRKSFHFWPLSVPAVCAALYFALHSGMVSASAGIAANMASVDAAMVHTTFARVIILILPSRKKLGGRYPSAPTARDNAAIKPSEKYS